jgi:primosomal protein N' (replication factor Y)
MDSSPASLPDAFRARPRLRVLLPQAMPGLGDGALDYLSEASLPPGTFVQAPLRNRMIAGVVWDGAPEGAETLDEAKVKPIAGVIDAPPLPDVSRRFVDWVAAYTMASPGAVLRMVMSVPDAFDPPPSRR